MKKILFIILLCSAISQAQDIFGDTLVTPYGVRIDEVTFRNSGDSLITLNGDTVVTRDYMRAFGLSAKLSEFNVSNLWLRSNVVEEYATNGNAEVAINYTGYNHGTSQFRDLGIYDGKNGVIAFFDGSDKTSYLYGSLNMTGQDITLDDITNFDDAFGDSAVINKAKIGNLEITGQILNTFDFRGGNASFHYGTTGQILKYNNTDVVFDIGTNGAVNTTGGYKLNGSALTITNLDVHLTDFPDQTGNNGKVLGTNGTALSWVTNASGAAWGSITGTLSAQTDLQTALNAKATNGGDITADDLFVSDTLTTGNIIATYTWTGDIRSTGTLSLNYNSGGNVDIYAGTSSSKFTVSSTGISAGVDISVPTDNYGADWSASPEAPTKGDLYAKIEAIVAGGATSFSSLTTGANTSATMTVGTGGVLTYSGTGVLNANQFMGVSSVDATEFGYLNGLAGAIATQSYVTSQGYITDGNSGWDNSYGFITDGNTGWDNSYGFITSSSLTNYALKSYVDSQDAAIATPIWTYITDLDARIDALEACACP